TTLDGGQGLEDGEDALQQDSVLGPEGALLNDDDATQLAPSLDRLDRAPGGAFDGDVDMESTGTIYVDHMDFAMGGDTIEQPRPPGATRNLTAIDLEPVPDPQAMPLGQDGLQPAEPVGAAQPIDEQSSAEPVTEDVAGPSEHGMLSDADLEAAQ